MQIAMLYVCTPTNDNYPIVKFVISVIITEFTVIDIATYTCTCRSPCYMSVPLLTIITQSLNSLSVIITEFTVIDIAT